MRFCRLGNERLISMDKFEIIKTSIFELFSSKEQSMINLYRSSLKLLFDKVKDPALELSWSSPIEITCLKEKGLVENDNTIDKDVEYIVDYLIGLDSNGGLQILDKPLYEVDI